MATPKPNELGMIPVVALKSFETWQQGTVFGVFPKRYEALVRDGIVELYEAPKVDASKASITGGEPKKVSIPENWETLHHKAIIAIAKKTAGEGAEEPATLEAAKEIIVAYLASV